MTNDLRPQVLTALAELGHAYPGWRFGQMIANLALVARGPDEGSIWEMEDDELLAAIHWHLKQPHSERPSAELAATN